MKLNKLIEDGKIPESCIYYKFLNDTMSFALTDPKTVLALNGMTRYVNFSRPSNTLEVREQESSSEGQASSEQGEAEKKNSNRSRILTCVAPP